MAIAASIGLHVALVWTVPARRSEARASARATNELTFELMASSTPTEEVGSKRTDETRASEPAQGVQAQALAPRPAPPSELRRASEREASAARVDAPAAAAPELARGENAEHNAHRVEPAAAPNAPSAPSARLDLSPRAVAMRMNDGAPGCAELRADAGPHCDSGGDDALLAEAANRRLAEALRGAAQDGLKQAPYTKPKLVRDGAGYRYEGSGFVGRIGADGSVVLDDRPGVQLAPIPIAGSFDLTNAIEGGLMGRELFATEKRGFLEQTEALRAELTERARERARQLGRSSLERELTRIARDATRPLAARHADIFALWDDCAADEHGTAAQALIERFVRREMPEGSAHAFTREELEALNGERVSARRFEPYAASSTRAGPG